MALLSKGSRMLLVKSHPAFARGNFEVFNLARIVVSKSCGLSTSSPLNRIEYEASTVPLEDNSTQRPLVVMFGWLLAKSRHLERYGNIYRHHGADVITVKLDVMEVVRPKLAGKVASEVIDLLKSKEHSKKPIVIHGFSVGGYLYSEVLNKLTTVEENTTVRQRIKGHVFDSPVDMEGIPYGVSAAAIDNKILRSSMKFLMDTYLFFTHRYTSAVYQARSKLFHNNPVIAPSLFLFSESDIVAKAENVRIVAYTWKDKMGMPVTLQCWDKSRHVSHMYTHPDEYLQALATFMHNLGIFPFRHDVEQLKQLL